MLSVDALVWILLAAILVTGCTQGVRVIKTEAGSIAVYDTIDPSARDVDAQLELSVEKVQELGKLNIEAGLRSRVNALSTSYADSVHTTRMLLTFVYARKVLDVSSGESKEFQLLKHAQDNAMIVQIMSIQSRTRAIDNLAESFRQSPTEASFGLLQRAIVDSAAPPPPLVLNVYSQAPNAGPDSEEAWNKGWSLLRSKPMIDRDTAHLALIAFRDSARLGPQRHEAWVAVAQLSALLGNKDDANRAIQTALELQPDEAKVLDALAEAFIRNDELDRAIQLWRRATSRPDAVPDHFARLAKALIMRNEYEAALKQLERAFQLREVRPFVDNQERLDAEENLRDLRSKLDGVSGRSTD